MTKLPATDPAHGVLIRCVLEDSPNEGRTAWIDLSEVEDGDHVQRLIDGLTGRADDPYPDAWNEEGTFEVAEVRGLGPRLAAVARDLDGPFAGSLADLAAALQLLEPQEVAPFLAWAEAEAGSYWLPGYASDMGGQLPEDAVLWFRCSTAEPLTALGASRSAPPLNPADPAAALEDPGEAVD